MSRNHQNSLIQKTVFILGHLIIILFCTWLVFSNDGESLDRIITKSLYLSDLNRAMILLACAFLYWFRHVVTLFYLLQRKIVWAEVFGLLVFFCCFEMGLILVGGGVFRDYSVPVGFLDLIAFALLLLGSFLNSYSEIQRKLWKQSAENKGRCYTQGLFSYSMHINFFGDIVLFIGWCLFTCNYWTLGLPLLMGVMFVFFHIPSLDEYLANRYGKEFAHYSKKTKKLIPYIY